MAAAACLGAAIAALGAGCGGDNDSTADEKPAPVAVAGEPANVFMERMAKLLATTTDPKDCAELTAIASRSVTQFKCPVSKEFRKSMNSFELVGAEEYGSGAVVDYKSGQVKDGAAITLFVTPDREWGVGRFGIVSKPSTETSDTSNRDGYAEIVDEYLAAVRERDCDTYFDITFNAGNKKPMVCKKVFPATAKLAKSLKQDPDVEPKYQGGNKSFGFYSFETAKPKPESFTISIAKTAPESKRPFVVIDVTPGPTAAQIAKAAKAFRQNQKSGGGMKPSDDVKPSEPAVPGQ